ncbi:hypothetical protein Q8A67_020215 [Cirrhinus molitorella]|uniref:Uncharacterized protein n=1 Tax=Cirrhinus molitorella TaxID=172907 RepID=A0AA88PC97_9TELE|nr:hypothetical protein Q8A67_020215 [Cirrhinus molitorella]
MGGEGGQVKQRLPMKETRSWVQSQLGPPVSECQEDHATTTANSRKHIKYFPLRCAPTRPQTTNSQSWMTFGEEADIPAVLKRW